MPKVYVLTFSIDDWDVQRLASIIDKWAAVIDWRSDTANSFLLLANESAETLATELMGMVQQRGAFLVSELSQNFQGWLMKEAWQFINQAPEYAPGSEEPGLGAPKAFVKSPRPPAPPAPPTPTERLAALRGQLGYAETQGSARKWWDTFEAENAGRVDLVVRLAEELVRRDATITEFFLSYVYSGVSNIQANLHYLDYRRLKAAEEKEERKERDRRKKEESARPPAPSTRPDDLTSPVETGSSDAAPPIAKTQSAT